MFGECLAICINGCILAIIWLRHRLTVLNTASSSCTVGDASLAAFQLEERPEEGGVGQQAPAASNAA